MVLLFVVWRTMRLGPCLERFARKAWHPATRGATTRSQVRAHLRLRTTPVAQGLGRTSAGVRECGRKRAWAEARCRVLIPTSMRWPGGKSLQSTSRQRRVARRNRAKVRHNLCKRAQQVVSLSENGGVASVQRSSGKKCAPSHERCRHLGAAARLHQSFPGLHSFHDNDSAQKVTRYIRHIKSESYID